MKTREDKTLWRGKSDVFKPSFSTKDTWNHTRTTSARVAWHSGVWFTHGTPKFSFCVWLETRNRLSTGDRISHWNRGGSTSCVFCNASSETRDHLFFSCSFTSQVQREVAKNILKTRYSTSWASLINSVSNKWNDRIENFIVRYVFQATVYTIWRERSRRRHGENPSTPNQLITWIDKQLRNQFSAIRATGDRLYEKGLQRWFESRL